MFLYRSLKLTDLVRDLQIFGSRSWSIHSKFHKSDCQIAAQNNQ